MPYYPRFSSVALIIVLLIGGAACLLIGHLRDWWPVLVFLMLAGVGALVMEFKRMLVWMKKRVFLHCDPDDDDDETWAHFG